MTNDQRDEMIQDTHDAVTRIETACCICRNTIQKHDKTLYGNGRIGLTSKVNLLMWVLWISSSVGILVAGAWAIKALAFGG